MLQGAHDDVLQGYRHLRDALAEVGLVIQPQKSLVYSPDFDEKDEIQIQLCIPAADRGLVVAGCPVGEPNFVAAHAYEVADTVEQQINTLMGLRLPAQDKLLLLRKSLQVKVSHLARCVPYDLLEPALRKSEEAVQSAVLSLIGREKEDIDVEQLYLRVGLGLQQLTAFGGVVCRAGFLAAASLAQSALGGGATDFQPLSACDDEDLTACWQQVTEFSDGPADLAGKTVLEAHTGALLGPLQRRISAAASEKAEQQLLGKYTAQLGNADTKVHAQEHLARLHGLQQGVGTAWLDVRPTRDRWELDDATVKSALRFMLGVSPGPAHQDYFRCSCGYKGSDCHHAMACDKLGGLRIVRHDQIQNMVQFGARVAGHSSSIEPQERHLKGLRYGDSGYGKRGDVCVGTLDDVLNVDITVPHPASYTYRSRSLVLQQKRRKLLSVGIMELMQWAIHLCLLWWKHMVV